MHENFRMLLRALVVRSNTQKEMHFSIRSIIVLMSRSLRSTEMAAVACNGTDKIITVAIEGIAAHGSGGNQGKILVF